MGDVALAGHVSTCLIEFSQSIDALKCGKSPIPFQGLVDGLSGIDSSPEAWIYGGNGTAWETR